ncbi:MAG: hypothetical protein KBT00_03020 [Bacteroidales bacterium]|nr:hypothetical protein [Candidatus Cacconaster merdequi]
MKQKKNTYEPKYCSLGGAVRIDIKDGEDIARLGELDRKLWTVHSCPVENLIFDKTSLSMLDADSDGRIRVNEVAEAARWVASALKDKNLLLEGSSSIALDAFSEEGDGKILREGAEKILASLGLDKSEISVEDIDKYAEGVADRCKASMEEEMKKTDVATPYGEGSADAFASYSILKAKIDDYFLRCSLVDFDEECSEALYVSKEKMAALADGVLSSADEHIAACPLSRPSKDGVLRLDSGINPAWQAGLSKLKALVFDVDFPDAKGITKQQWESVIAKMDAYSAALASVEKGSAEMMDSSLAAESALVGPLRKFIYLYRDIYSFIRNFVSVKDLYFALDKCMVNIGKLFIDQRCCELCIKVNDIAQHGDMAGLSGMYLIYCDCVQRHTGEKMTILATLTQGETRHIRVGKNAVFYDREGNDWDATVVKVVDNPINLRQAFWSPYRKFFNWCGEQINKMASDKESKSLANLQASASDSLANVQENGQAAVKKPAFDIAKFSGIFAAIGLALGYIGGFLLKLWTGFTSLAWWQMPLSIVAVMLVISLPSVFLAWGKLRRRNLAPVLNANGWAVNTTIPVNTRFGKFLTHSASFPKFSITPDPFAKKKTPAWKKWLIAILFLLVAAFSALYFTGHLEFIQLPFGL